MSNLNKLDQFDKGIKGDSDLENFDEDETESETSEESIDDSSSSDESEDSTVKGKNKKKKKVKKPVQRKIKQKIIFNVFGKQNDSYLTLSWSDRENKLGTHETRYPVVKFVGRKIFDWKLSYNSEAEWDVMWTDGAVQAETLAKMQEYQKINHFPGMYSLARKNHLGRHLMRLKKAYPENFKFFPSTWLLPTDYSDFSAQFTGGKKKTFIVKPEASCQGRGIYLTRSMDGVEHGEHYVIQRYLHKPYLIDGLKFDLRLYVLLVGCDPLRIYLYEDGLGRFATEEYEPPNADNLDNLCMHLTNYAINKDNPNFVFNENADDDDVGHKRSLKAVFKLLKEEGHDVKAIWEEIKRIIIKTFCCVQPILQHGYRSGHPEEPYNNMCFELLGFDIMLDSKLKPWLIEVNHTPSFATDTPLDRNIKKGAIRDALKLMNINVEQKIEFKNKKRAEMQQRVLTGKKIKMTAEERKALFEKAQAERDAWEAKNHGGYERIYPFDDPCQATEDYEAFIKVADQWWQEWTGTVKKQPKRSSVDPNKPAPFVFGNQNSANFGPAPTIKKNQPRNSLKTPKSNQNSNSPQKSPKPTDSIQRENTLTIEQNTDEQNIVKTTIGDIEDEDLDNDRRLMTASYRPEDDDIRVLPEDEDQNISPQNEQERTITDSPPIVNRQQGQAESASNLLRVSQCAKSEKIESHSLTQADADPPMLNSIKAIEHMAMKNFTPTGTSQSNAQSIEMASLQKSTQFRIRSQNFMTNTSSQSPQKQRQKTPQTDAHQKFSQLLQQQQDLMRNSKNQSNNQHINLHTASQISPANEQIHFSRKFINYISPQKKDDPITPQKSPKTISQMSILLGEYQVTNQPQQQNIANSAKNKLTQNGESNTTENAKALKYHSSKSVIETTNKKSATDLNIPQNPRKLQLKLNNGIIGEQPRQYTQKEIDPKLMMKNLTVNKRYSSSKPQGQNQQQGIFKMPSGAYVTPKLMDFSYYTQKYYDENMSRANGGTGNALQGFSFSNNQTQSYNNNNASQLHHLKNQGRAHSQIPHTYQPNFISKLDNQRYQQNYMSRNGRQYH